MFSSATPEALDLIRKLLIFNPNNRLTVEQALAHPYVKEFRNKKEEFVCNEVITILIDDNRKLTVKEYRDSIYQEISKKKKEQMLKL
jgi:mitogen-activated protein kinase 15